jgi:hypothetical protein
MMRVAQRLAGLFHSVASSAVRPAVVATWTPPTTTALQAPQAVLTSQQVPEPPPSGRSLLSSIQRRRAGLSNTNLAHVCLALVPKVVSLHHVFRAYVELYRSAPGFR